MSSTESVVTDDDVATLNRASVTRAATFVRLVGTAVVAVGGIGVAAWIWLAVHQQMQLDDAEGATFGPFSEDPSLAQRLDTLSATVTVLVLAAIALGLGLALRLAADYTIARTGGSVTGFEPGDPIDLGGGVVSSTTDDDTL